MNFLATKLYVGWNCTTHCSSLWWTESWLQRCMWWGEHMAVPWRLMAVRKIYCGNVNRSCFNLKATDVLCTALFSDGAANIMGTYWTLWAFGASNSYKEHTNTHFCLTPNTLRQRYKDQVVDGVQRHVNTPCGLNAECLMLKQVVRTVTTALQGTSVRAVFQIVTCRVDPELI